MNLADHARDIVAYNEWANTRMFDTARAMPAAEFAGLAETFTHLVETQLFWHANWAGADYHDITPGTYDHVRKLYDQSAEKMRTFFAGLTDDEWHRADPWWKRWGIDERMPLGETLFQVVNHSTQHRSEIASRMTELGYSPGELDYLVYRREQAGL